MATKTVTLEEVAEAIKKNGLEKYKGWEKRDDKGKLVAACAIAQGAHNLGVTYRSLSDALAVIFVFNGGSAPIALNTYIMNTNDNSEATIEAIGLEMERRVRAIRRMPLTVATA